MAPVRHHPAHLGAGAGILGCIFLSWLVLLAGIAACQRQSKSCPPRSDTRHLLFYLIWFAVCSRRPLCSSGQSMPNLTWYAVLGKTALEFEWWIICFEFLLVCLAATHLSVGAWLRTIYADSTCCTWYLSVDGFDKAVRYR